MVAGAIHYPSLVKKNVVHNISLATFVSKVGKSH